MNNSENPGRGAAFQRSVRDYFTQKYGPGFELEKKIPIGNPEKDHKFDIVNSEKMIVIECKRYTWTETGNVPSAKMGFTNEAAFYLSFLPDSYDKYIVMLRSFHENRKESLAEYYYRTNRHLLGKTHVAEFDPENTCDRRIGRIIALENLTPIVDNSNALPYNNLTQSRGGKNDGKNAREDQGASDAAASVSGLCGEVPGDHQIDLHPDGERQPQGAGG